MAVVWVGFITQPGALKNAYPDDCARAQAQIDDESSEAAEPMTRAKATASDSFSDDLAVRLEGEKAAGREPRPITR